MIILTFEQGWYVTVFFSCTVPGRDPVRISGLWLRPSTVPYLCCEPNIVVINMISTKL